MVIFKDILKELRAKRGLTQEQLADQLEVPHSNIRRYESSTVGLPHIERLISISEFFGVSIDQLIGRSELDIKFVEFIDLSNDELIKKPMYYKGKELSDDQKQQFIAIVRGIFDSRKVLKENR